MNHLAHCLLADPTPELLAGGFSGDFFRGPLANQPPALRRGIALHRRIDALSARIDGFTAAAAALPADCRRAAPIVIDLVADHFLAGDWQRWHDEPLERFERRVYDAVLGFAPLLPEAALRQAQGFRRHRVLSAYRDATAVLRATERIAARARPALAVQLHRCVGALEEDGLAPLRSPCLAGLEMLQAQLAAERDAS